VGGEETIEWLLEIEIRIVETSVPVEPVCRDSLIMGGNSGGKPKNTLPNGLSLSR